MKLYEKGELRREVWDLILRNTRLPELIEVDVDAMIGGCRVGEDRIRSLCDKYGPSSPTSSTSTSRSRAREDYGAGVTHGPITDDRPALDVEVSG